VAAGLNDARPVYTLLRHWCSGSCEIAHREAFIARRGLTLVKSFPYNTDLFSAHTNGE